MGTERISDVNYVPYGMVDKDYNMTVASYFEFFQELAGRHADVLGFGFDDLIKDRLVWIVSRIHFHFEKPVHWKDTIKLTTWHKGTEDGLFFRRESVFTDNATGEVVARGTSGWLLLDIDKRAMVRDFPKCVNEANVLMENSLEQPAQRLRMPRDGAVHCFDRVIRYSDIDFNGHTNNAKYPVWVMDAVAMQYPEARPLLVQDFEINFAHEAMLDDTVVISLVRESDKVCYVEGKVEGKTSFIAKVTLK